LLTELCKYEEKVAIVFRPRNMILGLLFLVLFLMIDEAAAKGG
jgi:hypothetical protein